MTLPTINKIFSDLFSSGWADEELDVVWHAGEPLVLPIEYYTLAFQEIARLTPNTTKVRHAFQTNAIFIDDEWCRFFKTHNVMLGVSIDGPEEIHNANRVTRSGKPTFSQAIAGVRCLRRNQVEFTVISVLTGASLNRAVEMHDFYVAEGIENVCFNIEEIEGSNVSSSLATEDTAARFEDFMRQLWNLNVQSNSLYYIREFKDMLGKIIRPSEYVEIDNTVAEPFEHLNVDCEGNYSTFSPEFLGHKNIRYNNFIIGNFWKNSLPESLESEAYKRLSGDVAAGVELCRSSCEYFSVCGGGSPVNKLYENGTIISTETMYCRLNVKVIAKLAVEVIENSAVGEVTNGRMEAQQGGDAAKRRRSAPLRPSKQSLRKSCNGGGGHGFHLENSLWNGDDKVREPRVVIFSDDPTERFKLVEVAEGTIRATDVLEGRSYEEGAIVPQQSWRPLTAEERKLFTVRIPPQHFGRGVSIIRLPHTLLEPFQALHSAAAQTDKEEDFEPLLNSADTREGTKSIVEHLKRYFQWSAADLVNEQIASGISVKQPGLTTVTVESRTLMRVGLHVDDWYSFPLEQRHLSPNRICVNLGCEDRFFLFLNVPLAEMYKELKNSGKEILTDSGGTPIARAFMALHPFHPILRVRVGPGEAYIAPTENIAHDASSIGMSTMDIALQIRGRFELSCNRGNPKSSVDDGLSGENNLSTHVAP